MYSWPNLFVNLCLKLPETSNPPITTNTVGIKYLQAYRFNNDVKDLPRGIISMPELSVLWSLAGSWENRMLDKISSQ